MIHKYRLGKVFKMTHTMIRYFVICILFLGVGRNICGAVEPTDIINRVQQRYAAGDFEADFFQESHLKAMEMVDTAKGHLYFGRPGTMRWHYQAPDEYFIISDGETVWIYRPEDNQVMVGRAADYFGDAKGADYLSRPGHLTRDFVLSLAPEELQEEELYVLRLVPKKEMPGLTELYLFISKEDFDIAKAVTLNSFGDRTVLRFDNYQFSRGLNPSLFSFKIPNGADVLRLEEQHVGY